MTSHKILESQFIQKKHAGKYIGESLDYNSLEPYSGWAIHEQGKMSAERRRK